MDGPILAYIQQIPSIFFLPLFNTDKLGKLFDLFNGLYLYFRAKCLYSIDNLTAKWLIWCMDIDKDKSLKSTRISIGNSIEICYESITIRIAFLPLEIDNNIPFLYDPTLQHIALQRLKQAGNSIEIVIVLIFFEIEFIRAYNNNRTILIISPIWIYMSVLQNLSSHLV